MSTLSRDAQVVAYRLFGMGAVTTITFEPPHFISSRALAAFDELARAGMIQPFDPKKLPDGSKGWQATPRIGRPWSEIPEPTEAELFPILSA
ncbi:hypothetical protein HUE56_29325 (plasmid) [Azospirillum oryzae]|uniref:Uncharacterized protein n=1 Tax=Azospirillum oryzae TaxID=286727 RepID=A0A6N1ATD7_9PROT|nr:MULTISPECIES: hypothetical protein [Azospirillum]KAA0585454.1 hypothetical protein FZ938_26140 [Azospirillum oryzae]PWC85682.1 hypothetical protein TSO5_26190 [Azospirillum sp. TSO5]QCG99154.1 hypothetical protein E6C67_35780 [Azospirillum sp. TSA2s]QKS54609.1 hypothetical protein HUE56_29325 [Azospirillum oryzae]GLR77491.1 hypothetical protein GCM10007856_01590 [Azospirillum oryzae]